MDNYVIELINKFGYFGMFLGMVLEAVIIIIPSELILATGGILAGRGIFSFWMSFFIGLLGSVFCAIVIYAMGYFGGYAFVNKYGKYFFMKEEDIERSDSWFLRYGMFGALIGRNFPIIRTLISLPIGIMRMSFFKFLIFTIIGSIPWTFLFVYLGYALGNSWIYVSAKISWLKLPIKVLLAFIVLFYFYKKITKKLITREK